MCMLGWVQLSCLFQCSFQSLSIVGTRGMNRDLVMSLLSPCQVFLQTYIHTLAPLLLHPALLFGAPPPLLVPIRFIYLILSAVARHIHTYTHTYVRTYVCTYVRTSIRI